MLFGANCIGKGAGGKYAVCALRIEMSAEKMVLQCAYRARKKPVCKTWDGLRFRGSRKSQGEALDFWEEEPQAVKQAGQVFT